MYCPWVRLHSTWGRGERQDSGRGGVACERRAAHRFVEGEMLLRDARRWCSNDDDGGRVGFRAPS